MGDVIADFIVWCITTWAGRVFAAVLVLLAVLGGWHMEYGTQHNVTFTINSIQDQANGSNGHKYLLFTTRSDGKTEVFENTDAFLHGKNDSSDVQARFLTAGSGSTWTCPVYGFRFFLFSSYRDILDGCVLVHKAGQPTNADVPAGNLYPTPTGSAPVTTQLTQTSP